MRRFSLLLAMLTAVVLSAGPGHAETYKETQPYTGGPGDDRVFCGVNLGGACFDLIPDVEYTGVSIKLQDDTGLTVGGYYTFRDSLGSSDPLNPAPSNNLGSAQFCDEITLTSVPEGANHLLVFIDGPVYGPQDCLLSHTSPGIGTTGYVHVTHEYEEL